MKYVRMPIEIESPEQSGYDSIACNLAESSVSDAVYKDIGIDLGGLALRYGHHVGHPDLRGLIASAHNGIKAGDVLLTAGAAAGLFITATSLLSEKDHLLVLHPNYATNIETPRAIGCAMSYVKLEFEKQFRLDISGIKGQLRKETRLISITYPHNPTGAVINKKELEELIKIAENAGCFLLVDETYRELSKEEQPPLAASLSDKVISISSVSKAYGLPGIRLGWIITQNKALQEIFLAAKEQIFVSNSVVDEEIAFQYLQKKDVHFEKIKKHIAANFGILEKWMASQDILEWVAPRGGVICFPRIKSDKHIDIEKFYSTLIQKFKTHVGPGHWFGMDRSHMRIGYGWPSATELYKGLENISLSLALAKK
jgi:aspartate/methionine/tyrosine aminotransferase